MQSLVGSKADLREYAALAPLGNHAISDLEDVIVLLATFCPDDGIDFSAFGRLSVRSMAGSSLDRASGRILCPEQS